MDVLAFQGKLPIRAQVVLSDKPTVEVNIYKYKGYIILYY